MDAGLVWVDRRRRQLAFAGAKISLYASDGEEVQELKGARRAIGDKRRGDYRNIEVPLAPGWTFYLSTDGFLDQAGGEHGFGFGSRRFADMLRDHARQPLPSRPRPSWRRSPSTRASTRNATTSPSCPSDSTRGTHGNARPAGHA